MMAAPLIAGNDIAAMTQATHDILTNREVIAVDQDALGVQGHRVWREGTREVWMKPYINRLRTEMPQLAEIDRRALITRMQETGVVKIEKRIGQPYDFSVLCINRNHDLLIGRRS